MFLQPLSVIFSSYLLFLMPTQLVCFLLMMVWPQSTHTSLFTAISDPSYTGFPFSKENANTGSFSNRGNGVYVFEPGSVLLIFRLSLPQPGHVPIRVCWLGIQKQLR